MIAVSARFEGPSSSRHSERDNGIHDATHREIGRATGDVIGLMHSDDFIASAEVLEKVVQAFDNPNFDGVTRDLDYVAADDTTRVIRRWRSGPYIRENLSKGWMPPHPTLYLRRAVFEELGVYDTSFRIAADYDAMLRILSKGGCGWPTYLKF